jgi:hypothetical protein
MTREFLDRAKKVGVADEDICEAIKRAENGSVDARLGSGLIKQRVGLRGRGKSGGVRTIIFYRVGDLAVCLHMFQKNAQKNLTAHETRSYRALAKGIAKLPAAKITALVQEGRWREIDYEHYQEEEVSKRSTSIASPGG